MDFLSKSLAMAQPVASAMPTLMPADKACPAKGMSLQSSLPTALMGCLSKTRLSVATAMPLAAAAGLSSPKTPASSRAIMASAAVSATKPVPGTGRRLPVPATADQE